MAVSTENCYLAEMPEGEVITIARGCCWYLREDDRLTTDHRVRGGLTHRNIWFVSEYYARGSRPLFQFDLFRPTVSSAPAVEVAKAEIAQWIIGARKLICKLLERVTHLDAASEARIQELELALALAIRSKEAFPDVMAWHARQERDLLIGAIPDVLDYITALEHGRPQVRPEVLDKWESIYRERAAALYRQWVADMDRRKS